MNNNHADQESYRIFQLMSELEAGETVSQRELAGRLGIAVGLVNSCLKNFVAKGYVRVKAFPRNRYAYLLTPKGFAEKGRLAFQHINYFTSLYTTTRQEYLKLFHCLKARGVEKVSFCGVDEVAEIAYLSLQEAGLELVVVADEPTLAELFFGRKVEPLEVFNNSSCPIILSTLKRRDELAVKLRMIGVASERIAAIGTNGG